MHEETIELMQPPMGHLIPKYLVEHSCVVQWNKTSIIISTITSIIFCLYAAYNNPELRLDLFFWIILALIIYAKIFRLL